LNYLYDQASATFSREGFLDLIQLLQRDTRITTIHVLAHSMGNQIVVDALANSGPNILAKPLGEVILAAPDVDWDVFTKLATKIVRTGRGVTLRGVTLYASSTDKALVASRKLAGGVPRAGDVLPEPKGPFVLKGIDTIDVSAIGDEMFGLNHNVFAAKRVLVDEIGRLMDKGDRPPSKRTPELRGFPEGADPPRYWRYPD
jgi:esterase/lipase superfamily enzyme